MGLSASGDFGENQPEEQPKKHHGDDDYHEYQSYELPGEVGVVPASSDHDFSLRECLPGDDDAAQGTQDGGHVHDAGFHGINLHID